MTTCQAKTKAKSGDTTHKAETGGSPYARGVSPTSNGPLNSFYSDGPILRLGPHGSIQGKLTLNQPNDRYEREADRVMRMPEPQGSLVQQQSLPFAPVQRKIKVEKPDDPLPGEPPRKAWEDVRDYIEELSNRSFTANMDGDVKPKIEDFCENSQRFTDCCLCDLHESINTEPWKIKIDDNEFPHTDPTPRMVFVHSTRSIAQIGAWGGGPQKGKRIALSKARVLGHELCGHAYLFEKNEHPEADPVEQFISGSGRPSHDYPVELENDVAREIFGPAAEQRGIFKDPHHGESFVQVTVSGFPSGSSSVSDLEDDMKSRIDIVKTWMKKMKGMKGEKLKLYADVIGHTDDTDCNPVNDRNIGQRALNVKDIKLWYYANHLSQNLKEDLLQRLSHQRALNVKDKLGIKSSRFPSVIGKGDRECPGLKAANQNCRKVDIFLFFYRGASEGYKKSGLKERKRERKRGKSRNK